MRRRTRVLSIAACVALTLGAGATTATVAQAAETSSSASAKKPTPDQPWRNSKKSPEWRATKLLAAMTSDEKITLVLATNDEDFAPLAHLGIPEMRRVDASDGLRGDTNVTAFPAPNALAATFDTDLALRYGDAIGAEARAKRWNVLLGPTVDIDRNGLSGRAVEGYGEDPLVNGEIGAAVAAGFEQQGNIAMLKHYSAYAQESGPRETLAVEVPERALHELYYPPFETAIRKGGADSVMCSYPQVNGEYACQNEEMLTTLKTDLGLDGYVATDFNPRTDWIKGFNAGVDSQSLFAQADRTPFSDGRISQERLNDAAYRILLALFDSGAFDLPLPPTAAEVATTPEHQALAVEAGEAATVLLKNSGALPLSADETVAIIGPSGEDTITGVEGSSYVQPGDFTTPAEAIAAKAGAGSVIAQGSLGDVPLPTVPASAFTHLSAEFFGNTAFEGDPIATASPSNIDFVWGTPVAGLPSAWSGRWTGTITSETSGLVRLSSLLSGTARVTVNDQVVFDGTRFIWDFFFAPQEYTIGGVVELEAGVPADIVVEYSSEGAGFFGPRLTLGWQPDSLSPAAREGGGEADVAVVFANEITGEAVDRLGLELPGDQNQLIEAVAAANPNTIVVLHTPGPVVMPWLDDVAGVVQGWYQGAAAGNSIANVLYGDAEPGGRLPVTFPASETQGPALVRDSGSVSYDEGIYVGYKWYDKNDEEPLFSFGYGLSYTTFDLGKATVSNLNTKAKPGSAAGTSTVTVPVTNTGDRAGTQVVQVYAGAIPTSAVETVEKTLAGFAKVELAPGQTKRVTVQLDQRALSYWDVDTDEWVTPRGTVPVYVGTSAADVESAGSLKVR